MKNLLTLAVLAFCCGSQAASLSWNWKSSDAIKFDTTSVGTAGTAYLLYIGNSDISTYSFSDYVDMASDTTSEQYVTTAATKLGKVNVKATLDDQKLGNYVTVLSYKSGDDTYWNVSSTVYNLTQAAIDALDADGTPLPDSSYSFSNSVSSGSGSVGGGWAQVPEPSTAALALAGLALLLKRRKA